MQDTALKLANRAMPAAKVIRVLAEFGPELSKTQILSELTHSQRSDALFTLGTLVDSRVLEENGHIFKLKKPRQWFRDLSFILEGIHLTTEQFNSEQKPEIVLTRPKEPSELDKALKVSGPKIVRIQETKNAFRDMADQASNRFVVMTPFLDSEGAVWLQDLFSLVDEGVEKILILRFLHKGPNDRNYPQGYSTIAQFLIENGVKVYDFAVTRPGTQFLETFHAKSILVDQKVAYVGSANMNKYSLDNSMEMGVLLKGETVNLVSVILNAILDISPEI